MPVTPAQPRSRHCLPIRDIRRDIQERELEMNTDLYELNEAELEQVAGGKTWGDMFNDLKGKWGALQGPSMWNIFGTVAIDLGDLVPGGTSSTGAGPAGGGAGPAPA